MQVKNIIEKYLRNHGYDGLYSDDCGCIIGDLAPCCIAENLIHCEPGVKGPCDPEFCSADGDCEHHIGPGEPHPPTPSLIARDAVQEFKDYAHTPLKWSDEATEKLNSIIQSAIDADRRERGKDEKN